MEEYANIHLPKDLGIEHLWLSISNNNKTRHHVPPIERTQYHLESGQKDQAWVR